MTDEVIRVRAGWIRRVARLESAADRVLKYYRTAHQLSPTDRFREPSMLELEAALKEVAIT